MSQAAELIAKQHGLFQQQRLSEGITGRQISIVMKDAAKEAEGIIARNLKKQTFSGTVRAGQVKAVIAGLGPMSTELWSQVERITHAGMFEAAQLATDQALDLDMFAGMPGKALVQYAPVLHMEAAHGVESLISRRTNGFKLSDRIYANGRLGVKKAAKEIEKSLVLQEGRQELVKRVRDLYDPGVPGGQSYAAKRLARTEINNAHHDTTVRQGERKPWVTGFKWNLSGSHPRPDVCNEYAGDDHDNLGQGVFKRGNVPSKPHPQCMCYVTIIQPEPDDFINGLVDGKYDKWLENRGVEC